MRKKIKTGGDPIEILDISLSKVRAWGRLGRTWQTLTAASPKLGRKVALFAAG